MKVNNSMITQTNDKLKAALWYATKKGWAVFPLHTIDENGICSCYKKEKCEDTGKHPQYDKQLIPNGLKSATTDETTILKWWSRWPSSNIGIATGSISGLVALDVDPRHGGDDSLKELENKYGALPETIEALTGGGGQHILFQHPGFFVKSSQGDNGGIAPGLDIKADGGYIVAAPSTHKSGNSYEWELSHRPEETELAQLPEWLLNMVQKNVDRTAAQTKAQIKGRVWERYLQGGTIGDGHRDNTLFSIGCAMRGLGASYEDILATLTAVNHERVSPSLDYRTVLQKADSAAKYTPGKSGLLNFPATDAGNAERLVDRHGPDLHYCLPLGGWLIWDGKKWAEDKTGEIYRRALETVRAYRIEAQKQIKPLSQKVKQSTDLKQQEELKEQLKAAESVAKFAKASEAKSKLYAAVELAQFMPGIPALPEAFDQKPWYLNLHNGTYDLKAGRLLQHDRSHLITKIAPVDYDPNMKANRWIEFLREIMGDDAEMVQYLKRKIGYALTGDTSEEDLDIFYGSGANGKSKFIEAILNLMGDYGQQAPTTLLMNKGSNGGPTPEIVRLRGARFVATVETGDGKKMDEEFVKQLTGRDRIAARDLYKGFIEFEPEAKVFLATNYKPTVKGDDGGIWRRLRLLPFEVTIPAEKRDKHLSDKLKVELPGILNWALEGLREWQQQGLQPPAKVLAATEEYKEEMDGLGAFLSECCVKHWEAKISIKEMYRVYVEWCEDNGETPMKNRMLTKRLTERGFRQGKSGSVRLWDGLGLLEHFGHLADKDRDKRDKRDTNHSKTPENKNEIENIYGNFGKKSVPNVPNVPIQNEVAATREQDEEMVLSWDDE